MPNQYLRRYTDIPSLIGMLTYGELTLLEPATWDDKNDSYFLDQYKSKRELASVLALCFTRSSETYHHWRVFSPGPAGVCVWFKEEEVKAAVKRVPGLLMKPMTYLTVDEIRKKKLPVNRLPFVKRYPFKPEQEIRILWESSDEKKTSLHVPFPSSAIERITLSPWLHRSLADPLRSLLKTLPECRRYKIYQSTLVGNDEWKRHGRKAA
jgi:hypothetical protein